MVIDLNQDQKKKLKELIINKRYSEFEFEVEQLGKLEQLPIFLIQGYAGSKVLNPLSKKADYLKATIILEKIYQKNKSNLEAFYNLIISSLKAEETKYVLRHLIERYEYNKKDLKVLEGLARCHFLLANMNLCTKFFKELLDLSPKSTIDGGRLTYLASLNYISDIDQTRYFNECVKLGQKYSKYSNFEPYKINKSYTDKIKIGFISGDFRNHSVNFFLRDLIQKLDKSFFCTIALSNLEISRHDEVTKFYQKNFNEWYDIYDYEDKSLIKFIRSLEIDILIDLNGFTYGNRIGVLAARCAKIQIEWMGYNNSTGLENMDFIIADKNMIKKDEEINYSEKIIYLPKIWNAMYVPPDLPAVNEAPHIKNKIFNYGSFNSFKKISNSTVRVWSQILNNSHSQLYLKNSGGFNKELYDNLLQKFLNHGVEKKKIIFLERSNQKDFLKDYYKIDLALDTFPYTGVTTTFQALIMGVPVLTLKGMNMNSRCGESININLGMKEFIASNEEDYVKKAISFQTNTKLNSLRTSLRSKALKSSLFDTDDFSKSFGELMKSLLIT
jgi:protein O-GlcNAc transferase